MNKKFTKLLAALALLVFMTLSLAGWGQTTVTVNASKVTSTSFTWHDTDNTVTWNGVVNGGAVNQNMNNGYAQIGTSSSPSTSVTLSTSSISGTITSVVLNCAAYQGKATVSATVGGEAFGTQSQSAPSWSSNSGGDVTFTNNNGASGQIVVTMTNGTGGRAMYIKSISVTYTTGSGTTTYTVTYDGNGSDSGTVPVDNNEYEEGDEVTVLGPGTMAKTGHTFEWWEDAEGTPYEEDDTFEIYENTTLTAQWTVNTYDYTLSVTGDDEDAEAELEVDGATVATGAKIAYNKEVTVIVATNDGYTYSIAVEDADHNAVSVANDKFTMPASNVTVTVTTTLIPTYTIDFEAGTGTAVSSITGLEGSTITLPTTTPSAACVSRGWTFAGWATASVSETTTAPTLLSGQYTITGNATLYAVYKVTEGDGGEQEFDFPAIAVANGWENGEAYTEVTIGQVTIEALGGGNNGKWYTTGGGSWRMYSGGTVQISAANNAVTAVTSAPSCEFTISNGIATFSPSARTDFTNITVTYGSSTITYNSNPSCFPMVATPTFTPVEGTYTGAQNVSIECDTDEATILYKTAEEGEWMTYNAAIPVSTTTTIWAKATKDGMDESEIATATYTIQYTLTVDIDDVVEYSLYDNTNETWEEITIDDDGHALVFSGADVRISGGEVYDDCYEVESFNVTDGDNNPVTVVDNTEEDGTYSFIMPASNATLTATVNEIANHYTLTVVGLDYVDFELLVGSMSSIITLDANHQASICEQSDVTIANLTANTGLLVESVTLTAGGSVTSLLPEYGVYNFTMPSYNATLTIGTAPAPTYTLATTIKSGKHYIITNGTNKAMGGQNTNNRAAVNVEISNGTAYVSSDDVYEFVIEGPEIMEIGEGETADVYTIYDARVEGYLYAASGSKNWLRTDSGLNDNGKWTISFGENGKATIKAQGANTHNWMRYNSSDNLFSCYASGQDDIYLYINDEDLIPETETFTLHIEGYDDPTNNTNYYLIASPLQDPVMAGTVENLTNAEGQYDLYAFDQSADKEWINSKRFDSEENPFGLFNGQGYLYANRNDVDIVFTGVPFVDENNSKSIQLSYDEEAELAGWNLVGNPFGNLWVEIMYNNENNEFVKRDYYKLNPSTSELYVADPAEPNDYIAPMEGAFVKAETNNEFIYFAEVTGPSNDKNVVLNLTQNRGNMIDRAIVRFGEGRQLPKFQINKNNTKVYIPQGNQDYAVVYSEGMGELPVNFRAAENGTYTLSMDVENMEMNYLHLIDNMTGMDVDLLQTPSYTFEATTRDYESRFKLVFAGASTGSAADETFAFFSNGNLIVNNEGNATLQVIDLTGRILSSESISGSCSTRINATPGVYMLRLINGDNVKVQKVVVR